MTGLDNTYDPLAWGSHLPALLACLADTVGPVLEIGVGHFSTPVLHAFCVQADRNLVSVEKDINWFDLFSKKYTSKTHKFDPDTKVASCYRNWAVVLIDDSPGGENRSNHFSCFIQRSAFVVVHDYHKENQEASEPLLQGINHHATTTYQPPTLIASRIREIPQSILCL